MKANHPTPVSVPGGRPDARDGFSGLAKYQLLAEVARGGLGIVYLAVAPQPGPTPRLLALKELRDDLLADPTSVAMFRSEARIAALIDHPNLVQTLEVDSHGARPFRAMEYVDGQPLRRLVQRAHVQGRPMPLPMHLRVLTDVLAALEYTHSLAGLDGTPLGLVHRDLGPQNVVVTYEGAVKLIDFGVPASTGTTTPPRADIFAAGVMLWEGVVMSRSAVGPKHRPTQPPGASGPRRDVDPELFAIVERAMNSDPAARYPTALSMREALDGYVAKAGLALPNAGALGAFLSQLFVVERRAQRAIVDRQLHLLRRSPSEMRVQDELPRLAPAPIPVLPTLESTPTTPSVLPRSRPAPSSFPPTEAPARGAEVVAFASVPPAPASVATPATPAPPSRPGSRIRGRLVAFAGAGAALSALATFAALGASRHAGAPLTEATAVTTAPARAVLSPMPTADRVTTFHRVVRARPLSVRLYVDDAVVPNPYVADLPPDPTPHRVFAEAPGYTAQEETVTFDRDLVVHFALAAAREEPPAAVAPAPPARKPVWTAFTPRVTPIPPPAAAPVATASPAPVAAAVESATPAPLSAVDKAPKPDREIYKQNPYLQ